MPRSFARRVRDRVAVVRGRTRSSPFVSDSRVLLVHCCYHKTGTAWFRQILNAVARRYGFPMIRHSSGPSGAAPPIARLPSVVFDHGSWLDIDQLPGFRGAHMIRDPRDVVVSGYHYHRWTNEPWANRRLGGIEPGTVAHLRLAALAEDSALGDLTYREYLSKASREEGIEAEIRFTVANDIHRMVDWDYDDERFLELEYEDAFAKPRQAYERLFRHYGFCEPAVSHCVEIAEQYSFSARTGREPGVAADGEHARSGTAGQWRDEFTSGHRRLFEDLYGASLDILGYERDRDC